MGPKAKRTAVVWLLQGANPMGGWSIWTTAAARSKCAVVYINELSHENKAKKVLGHLSLAKTNESLTCTTEIPGEEYHPKD